MNLIKSKVLSLLEKKIGKNAQVLDVRHWHNRELVEIDLHVPDMQVNNWSSAQHIKIKVAPGVYRDYSPAMWDEGTKTCSLLVDAAHLGAGSTWAQRLRPGDEICYLGIADTTHRAYQDKHIFCIGDESSLAHFLALNQLLGRDNTLHGVIAFSNKTHIAEYNEYFRAPFKAVFREKSEDWTAIVRYMYERSLKNESIYIAGGYLLVSQIRKQIKDLPGWRVTIKVQGFTK